MFIEKDELKSAIYEYQIAEITEADDAIVLMAISAAVAEMKGYLRSQYDTEQIFSATGDNRNALVLELCKNIAVWYLIRLCNVDMIYEHVKDRYDRAIEWLKQVASGNIAPELPPKTDDDGDIATRFQFGSNVKFNSSWF